MLNFVVSYRTCVVSLLKYPSEVLAGFAFCGWLDVDLLSEENTKVVYTVKTRQKVVRIELNMILGSFPPIKENYVLVNSECASSSPYCVMI